MPTCCLTKVSFYKETVLGYYPRLSDTKPKWVDAVSKSFIVIYSRNIIARLKNHDTDSALRQDTDVSKHVAENPDHKINFTETEIRSLQNPYTINRNITNSKI